jgi:protein ATS1
VSVSKEVLFDGSKPPPSEEPPIIRAGGNHTLLLIGGQLYCSGESSTGACGLTPEEEQHYPHFRKVLLDKDVSSESESKVIFCAATWEASFIVKNDNHGRATQVYSFGTGNKGELGLGELIFRSAKAQLIKDFPPADTEVVDLAASVSHVVAVLSNGDVYGWGNGRKFQLGVPGGNVFSPRNISDIGFEVTRAVCGREFTYLVGDPEDGQHAIIGADKWDVMAGAPKDVKGWKDIGAGWGSIIVLLEDGKLISWGRDDHGQLPPLNLPEVSQIAVGSEHASGTTAAGDVLAWGWGEHGNCGPSTTNRDVKGRWNVIASSKHLPAGTKILSVGAGCATSWISTGP